MAKLFMLAGGIVEPGSGQPGRVSAFVAFNPKPTQSRLFKVHGPATSPEVTELPSATTVDLGAFRKELTDELEPEVEAIRTLGGISAIAVPKTEWVLDVVKQHLRAGGLEI